MGPFRAVIGRLLRRISRRPLKTESSTQDQQARTVARDALSNRLPDHLLKDIGLDP